MNLGVNITHALNINRQYRWHVAVAVATAAMAALLLFVCCCVVLPCYVVFSLSLLCSFCLVLLCFVSHHCLFHVSLISAMVQWLWMLAVATLPRSHFTTVSMFQTCHCLDSFDIYTMCIKHAQNVNIDEQNSHFAWKKETILRCALLESDYYWHLEFADTHVQCMHYIHIISYFLSLLTQSRLDSPVELINYTLRAYVVCQCQLSLFFSSLNVCDATRWKKKLAQS